MQWSDDATVLSLGRLPNGLLFGLPVVLDTDRADLTPGTKVCLTQGGNPVATMDIESRWSPDKPKEALRCYGTSALEHPGVRMIAMERKHEYIGGNLTGLARPERVFFCETPAEVRATLPAGAMISTVEGGFFCWLVLPKGVRADAVIASSMAHEECPVSALPGSSFSPSGSFGDCIRMAFTFYDAAQLARAGAVVGSVVSRLAEKNAERKSD